MLPEIKNIHYRKDRYFMEIKKTYGAENQLTISVSGRLNTESAPELSKAFNESAENVTDLTFDLAGLEYISSAGLRVILAAQKIMEKQGKMRMINVSQPIMDIFEITDFVSILTIE